MSLMLRLTLPAMIVLAASAPVAAFGPQREHSRLPDDVSEGRVLRQRDVERRILPHMVGADYLGPEYDQDALVYRLKFLRAGRVFWVDVDARTGDVIGRSGR